MTVSYIAAKTARLFEANQGSSRSMVLIFGDEVEATGPPTNRRVPVLFRGRGGWVEAGDLSSQAVLEIYFIDVGQGDSAFIVTPGRKKILIDGGVDRRALQFLSWKYRLDQDSSRVTIDQLILSHGDTDHLGGLAPIVSHPKINVRKIAHSGIATYQSGAFDTVLGRLAPSGGKIYLETRHDRAQDLGGQPLSPAFQEWITAVLAEGADYRAVDRSTGVINVGDPDIRLEILGPVTESLGGATVFRWFGDPAHTINGHSVVARLDYRNVSLLLAGDINIAGAKHLLADTSIASKLAAHVFKAPHHGSHEFHAPFLEAVRPQISVISSGDEPDHGHPRAVLIGAIGKDSRSDEPLVFSTEIAATFVEARGVEVTGGASTDPWGAAARTLFKRRLHGMINVRTDGQSLYAARRVAAGYWWEAYGPVPAAP